MEPHHDEEIENAILENRSHQSGHARLAVLSFEFRDEDDDANEGNKVCTHVRWFWIYARQPVTHTGECDLQPVGPPWGRRDNEVT